MKARTRRGGSSVRFCPWLYKEMRCQPHELVAPLDRRLDMMAKKIFLSVPGVKMRLFSCLFCATQAHILI